jgi:hypothetical protein
MEYKTYVKSEYNGQTNEYTFISEDGDKKIVNANDLQNAGVGSIKVPIKEVELGDYSEVIVTFENGYITDVVPTKKYDVNCEE